MALKSGETGSGESHTTIFTIKTNLFWWFWRLSVSISHVFFTEMESLCTDGQIAPISATKRGLSGLTWEGIASCSVATCYQGAWFVRTGCPVIAAQSRTKVKFRGPLAKIRGVAKKRHGHNFQNWGSISNQRGVKWVSLTLLRYGAEILKIVAVSFFL